MLVYDNFFSLTNIGGQKINTYDRFRLRGGRTLLGQKFQPNIRLYEATVFLFFLRVFLAQIENSIAKKNPKYNQFERTNAT